MHPVLALYPVRGIADLVEGGYYAIILKGSKDLNPICCSGLSQHIKYGEFRCCICDGITVVKDEGEHLLYGPVEEGTLLHQMFD